MESESDLSLTGAETVMDAENVEDVERNDNEARAGDEEADDTCGESSVKKKKINAWTAIGMPKRIFVEGPSRKMKFATAWKSARLTVSKDLRFNPLRTSTPQPQPVSRDDDGSPPRSPSRTVPADPGISLELPQDETMPTNRDPHVEARIDEEMRPSTSRAQLPAPGGSAASQPVHHDDEASFEEEMPPATSAPYAEELEEPSTQLATRPLERLSNDQLLVFSAKVYDHTSFRQVIRDFRFSAFNSTHGVHMTAEQYLDTTRKIVQDHGLREEVLCSFCEGTLRNKNAVCQDSKCKLQSLNPTLGTVDKRVVIISCDSSVQLKEIVERNFEAILRCHVEVHDNANPTRRRDCRDFKKFRDGVESAEEFRNKEIQLQLLLSVDGFSYPENQRGSTWFTTARILDIPPGLRVLKRNSILVSSISSGRIPNHSEFWTANSGFLELIQTSSQHPIEVEWSGVRYEISFGVTFVTADHQAIMKCYRIKGCHGNYGCCRCYDKGDTYRRRHVWPKTDTTTPRTPSSVTRDINLRINGVYGKSIFSEICPMSDVVVDFLHNGPEGPIKRIIEETFGISGKSTASWPIRLRQADVELVDRLLKTTAMNSNARGAPRALSDIKNMNGTQFMELFEFVIPVITFECCLVRKDCIAAIYALLFVLKMETSTELDVWICERLAWILQTLSGIFDKLFGNEFATIKKHWLFDHHAEDLLQNGAPQELSSSSFEKDYRLHKKAVAVGNTRAVEHASWTKHLLVSSTLHELCRRGESQNNKVKLSQLCLSGTASLESAEFHRLNDVVYNMSNNYRVNRMALSASDLSLFDQLRNDGFSTFLTRVIYKGLMFGTSVAVEGKHTQNHVISFYHNGVVRVGSVVIFAVGEDAIFMAVRCYDHASPFDRLKRWLRRNNQKELCEIYDFIDSYNSFWFLLPDDVKDNSSVFITEANNIRGPGLTFNVASSKRSYFICKKHNFHPE